MPLVSRYIAQALVANSAHGEKFVTKSLEVMSSSIWAQNM